MSLTSRINSRKPEDQALRDLLKSTMPDKALFMTLSGKTAFAASQYDLLAPYRLTTRGHSGISGTAFDYLARAKVARTIRANKAGCLRLGMAEKGLESLRTLCTIAGVTSAALSRIGARYAEARCLLNYFIHEQHELDDSEAISICCLLARLEHVARQGVTHLPYLEHTLEILASQELSEITSDIEGLSRVFDRRFMRPEVINRDSAVVFNPCFMSSHLLGGADADIVIDGTLYDFKTSKDCGYKWQDVAQLWGYYLLSQDKGVLAPIELLEFYDGPILKGGLTRLAFYRARFGEVEYVDLERIDERTRREALNEFMSYLTLADLD